MIVDVGMHLSWSAFHSDAIGARTQYLRMIARVAQQLVGRSAVIGYDMMNEPWGDEPTDLYRLYEDAAVAIRRSDPSAILFVSPHALISAGTRSNLKRPSIGNFAFAPHFYDASVLTLHAWLGGSLDGVFANMRGVADSWGVPLFVGEMGAPADTRNVGDYLRLLYDGLDATLASATQWVHTPGWTPSGRDGWNGEDLSIFDDHGAARANFLPRPYPRRIAGTPTRFAVEQRAAGVVIELSWVHDPSAGETEIYVPIQSLSAAAMLVVHADGARLTCASEGALVRCASSRSGPMRVAIEGR
jgi:endoglycosylceramidase